MTLGEVTISSRHVYAIYTDNVFPSLFTTNCRTDSNEVSCLKERACRRELQPSDVALHCGKLSCCKSWLLH
jgi:hypothetical protein